MGYVTRGTPSPNPNYKQVRASGSPDYYINQRMSVNPTARISLIPNKVGFLTSLVSASVAPWATPFTLFLKNDVSGQEKYVWLKGSYVDTCRIKCDIDDHVMVDLDLVGMTTNVTALANSIPADPTGDDIDPLYYRNVTLSKDGTAIDDWTTVSFELNKNFMRRLTPSTGATRALATVARGHSISLTRDMDSGTALDEYVDIVNDTTKTMKLLLANPDASASWSVTLNNAKTQNVDLNILEPESLNSKEISYQGSSLTFGTS